MLPGVNLDKQDRVAVGLRELFVAVEEGLDAVAAGLEVAELLRKKLGM